MTDIEIVHNEAESRFETTVDDETGVLLYIREPKRITFVSTRVPTAIEGRGIGSALIRTGLDYARDQSLTVVPQCPFVRVYVEKHPEYKSLTV